MALDTFTIRRIAAIMNGYIAHKVPHNVRDSVRLTFELEENVLTLTEHRPSELFKRWKYNVIAQFHYEDGTWIVYARNGDEDWKHVRFLEPSKSFETMLEYVELDVNGEFWQSDDEYDVNVHHASMEEN